ncbi:MAG: aminotransferase class I/II-fold pyridoxal phosphate-dependent enzyme [Pseudomonadota bacterium]
MAPKSPIARQPWPESASRPMVSPLQPTVVYASDSPDTLDAQYAGDLSGYTYAREGHPNADVVARMVDELEGAEGGLVTGSGMAAVTAAVMGAVKAGDHVIGGDQLYGRSLRLLNETLPAFGVATSTADATDAAAVAAAITEKTRLILIEIVSNPTIRVADLQGIAALARERGILLAVDNTFTTPRSIRPFDHGADLVIHSLTKILSGHSDTTLGYVAARDAALREQIEVFAVTAGLTPSPFDCWLAERGLLSFALRFDRAESNAAALADALGDHPAVQRVFYPTRADHPDHNRAIALLGDRGSHMLSFEIAGGRGAANALVKAMPELPFAPTLGDIGTTLSHPATSSHRGLTPEARGAIGISEGFFRVSVGCEEPGALAPLFARGLDAAVRVSRAD